MGHFSAIRVSDDGLETSVDVPEGGALLARALLAVRARDGESPTWRAVAEGACAGGLSGGPLSTAIGYLARLGDAPGELLSPADDWTFCPRVPPEAEALARWGRDVALEADLDGLGDPREQALALLRCEGRALVFGGRKLTVYDTATGVLGEIARLVGVEVTSAVETWDPTCTHTRLRAGLPVGGGELHFVCEDVPHRVYLSFDTWFDFHAVETILRALPERAGRAHYAVPELGAVLRIDEDEAARLLVEWDLRAERARPRR